jgi:pimeloyl-ACP methyl ester carboxylesterase
LTPNFFKSPDGLSLAWYELGSGDGNPPIVVIHGFSSSTKHEWEDSGIASAVRDLGRRIIGYDARGHGNSEKPHDSRFYGGDFMARDAMALVTHLGITSYDLVGYSMGGSIATVVASFDRRVRRAVIGGVGHGVATKGGLDKRVLDSKALAAGLRADSEDGLSDIVKTFRRNAIARGNDLLALAAHSDALTPRTIDFSAITAQALVIAGDTDPLAEKPEVLASAIPGGRLAIVPGDHYASKRSPEFRQVLLDFLA